MNEQDILADLHANPARPPDGRQHRPHDGHAPADVPNWDSFAYINFIVAVEMELGIKFSVAEVESFETVGESWPPQQRACAEVTRGRPVAHRCCSIRTSSSSRSCPSRCWASSCWAAVRATSRCSG